MQRMAAWTCCAIALAAFSSFSQAAQAPENPEPGATEADPARLDELEELTVTGRRPWQLRREIARVEESFYEIFNRINSQDEFDIHCVRRADTNTNIKRRSCLPQAYLGTRSAQARAFLDGMMLNDRVGAEMPERAALHSIEERFRSNARAVIAASPELQLLSRQWQELMKEYSRTSAR